MIRHHPSAFAQKCRGEGGHGFSWSPVPRTGPNPSPTYPLPECVLPNIPSGLSHTPPARSPNSRPEWLAPARPLGHSRYDLAGVCFGAASVFTRVTACHLADDPTSPPVSQASTASLPPRSGDSYPVGTTVTGAGLPPAGPADLVHGAPGALDPALHCRAAPSMQKPIAFRVTAETDGETRSHGVRLRTARWADSPIADRSRRPSPHCGGSPPSSNPWRDRRRGPGRCRPPAPCSWS